MQSIHRWARAIVPGAALASGCVVVEKSPDSGGQPPGGASTSSGASSDAGPGPDVTGVTTGGEPGACTEPMLPDNYDDICAEDTAIGADSDWEEFLQSYDPAAFEAIACPWQDPTLLCEDPPIAGLAGALVVENGKLPAPRPFLPPEARLFVVSNVALECADPLAAPLCAGQWRISVPMHPDDFCFSALSGEWGSSFVAGGGSPVLLEYGDAACATHTGRIADGGELVLHFPACPAGAPIHAQLCTRCELPGLAAPVNGSFSPQICP